MKRRIFIIILALFALSEFVSAQGFKPPAPGKAAIYFVRTAGYWKVSYDYFHNNEFIGDFKHKDYIRYECPPGKQLFWAKSENSEFMEADLKEGGTYIVHINIIIGTGFAKANIGFTPVTFDDKERFDHCKELVMKKAPIKQTEAYIQKRNAKLKKMVDKNLDLYEKQWKNEKNFRKMTPEMAIPVEALK